MLKGEIQKRGELGKSRKIIAFRFDAKSRAVTDPVERLERSEAMEPFDRLRAGYGTIGTTR